MTRWGWPLELGLGFVGDGPHSGPAHLHTPQLMFSAAAFRP